MTIEDRAYQSRALDEVRAAFARKRRAVLLVAPTGAGKTTIAGLIAQGAVAKGRRVVMLAHRRELIAQAVGRFRSFGLDVGWNGINVGAPVQVTSPQVILARRQMPEADLCIPDEAHHYVSEEWGQIFQGYRAAGARIVGLTATPERGDGLGLGGADGFDELVVVAQIHELTELGFLVPCDIIDPTAEVNKLACEPWEAYVKHSPGRSAVVFAPHVKAAEDFAADFRRHGVDAGVVEGKMSDEDRDDVLARFASGALKVIVNVMVLTEGWDCPIADVCILARRVGSPSLFLQMVGRVLRPSAGKTRALLIDLAGNVELHGEPDEARLWSLDGAACSRMATDPNVVRKCRACRNEIPAGLGLTACPTCGLALPVQRTPRGEDVELRKREKEERQNAIASMPEDRRVRMLATLYVKALRKGHKRKAAEMTYRSMTKRYPSAAVGVRAWAMAQEEIASEEAARDTAKERWDSYAKDGQNGI